MDQTNNLSCDGHDSGGAFRILDANLNRAREGLRVLEEYARFILNDAAASERCKQHRHALVVFAGQFRDRLLTNRDTPGDIGTTIKTPTEKTRTDSTAVARAAAGRLTEALRCLEEYGKAVRARDVESIERIRYDVYSIEQHLFGREPLLRRLSMATVHLLLTESLCKDDWKTTVEAALIGGADVIQLREKSLTDQALLDRARFLRELTTKYNALLIINDRADIARLCDADGVHLGQEDLHPRDARKIIGPIKLLGVSTHNLAEATNDRSQLADYLGVGTMFASQTKPNVEVGGVALLNAINGETAENYSGEVRKPNYDDETALHFPGDAARSTFHPLVAIGGITPENAAIVATAIPHRVQLAVSQAILAAPDPESTTRRLVDIVRNAREAASCESLDTSPQ